MIPPKLYWAVVVVAAVVLFVPALIAGGGFIIAVLLVVALVAAATGVPYLKDLYMTQHMGSKGRGFNDEVRDLLAGDAGPGPNDSDSRAGDTGRDRGGR